MNVGSVKGVSQDAELRRINSFLARFARREAGRVIEVTGGFAALHEEFTRSRANNQLVLDGAPDPAATPRLADDVLGHLPYRRICVLREDAALACRAPLLSAGYEHTTVLVMRHSGPVPWTGRAEVVAHDVLREPYATYLRGIMPDVDETTVRHLTERRPARQRGADIVEFLASRTPGDEVASWTDLYLDPATGVGQIEDLATLPAHTRRGHGDAVLATALRRALDTGCETRFLLADAEDWPQEWYARRGFEVLGRSHTFERVDS